MAGAALALKVREVAEVLQVSENHVREMVHRGDLPKVPHMGRVVRIPRHAVEALVGAPVKQGPAVVGAVVGVDDGSSFR
jgi:excisionase family DNA binding protein